MSISGKGRKRVMDAAGLKVEWNEQEFAWTVQKGAMRWQAAQAGFYTDLYRTLREGAPLVITPESVRRQIAIIEKCRRMCPV